jgi:hypothetical protein
MKPCKIVKAGKNSPKHPLVYSPLNKARDGIFEPYNGYKKSPLKVIKQLRGIAKVVAS